MTELTCNHQITNTMLGEIVNHAKQVALKQAIIRSMARLLSRVQHHELGLLLGQGVICGIHIWSAILGRIQWYQLRSKVFPWNQSFTGTMIKFKELRCPWESFTGQPLLKSFYWETKTVGSIYTACTQCCHESWSYKIRRYDWGMSWTSVAESIFFPKVDNHCPSSVKGLSLRWRVGNINLRYIMQWPLILARYFSKICVR